MPFETIPDGVRVRVRLTASASKDLVKGVAADENGVAWLTASVTTVPEDGRANKALVRLLSKEWRIAKSSIQLITGQTNRRKILLASGDPVEISRKLAGWIADRRIECMGAESLGTDKT